MKQKPVLKYPCLGRFYILKFLIPFLLLLCEVVLPSQPLGEQINWSAKIDHHHYKSGQ